VEQEVLTLPEQEVLALPEYLCSSTVVSEVCVAQSLAFYIVLCRSLIVLFFFVFSH
jgi:hypothetical protein